MAKRKRWERYSLNSLMAGKQDERGSLFLSELGQVDLSGVSLLHSGVDTVRQLYRGIPEPRPLEAIQTAYDAGFNGVVSLGGVSWLIGSGGKSGYRYRLQNSDLGLIAFLGSRYAELDKDGSHLKIEVSPHFIDARETKEIQAELYRVARELLSCPQPVGVAVHLATDVQGWTPPKDFEERFVTRSKRKMVVEAMESLEFNNLSEVAAIYGDRETFMFGTASALQFSMYRKDREATKRDKMHFWRNVWERTTSEDFNPLYKPDEAVWRFEVRFHHSVIAEFAEGLGKSLLTFEDVAEHLTGLWRYALETYRLDKTRTYIDPFWQLLLEDVEFFQPARPLIYKRARKSPGEGNERNLAIALGNMISIYARNRIGGRRAIHYLRNSGLWSDIVNWCWNRQMSPDEFERWVEESINVRILQGRAA